MATERFPHRRIPPTPPNMSTQSTQADARSLEHTGLYRDFVDIEERVRKLESRLDEFNEKQEAHIRAKYRDAREILERGETRILVVITTPEENDGSHAISKIEGIYTFIEAGPTDLHRGDVVRARVVDVGDNHAEALALARLDQEGEE